MMRPLSLSYFILTDKADMVQPAGQRVSEKKRFYPLTFTKIWYNRSMRRRKEKITMTVKVGKVAVGHQANTHQVHDNRPKRNRTRSQQRLNWRKENDC
jgi:hypothetical protein